MIRITQNKQNTKKLQPYLKGFVPFVLGAFLVGIVGGFTTVLGPAFVKDLNLDYNNTTWTALALAISSSAFAPILGKIGDVVGRKRTLIIGIVIFTVGNILSAMSDSLPFMLVARFIVGLGSAGIAPVVMSYIVTEFPYEKQAKGFSFYMLISSCAVIFGPTIGGMLINAYGWRAMMYVCSAICVLTLLICIFLKGSNDIAPRKFPENFDYAGAVLIVLFFGLLLCVPSFGQNFGWISKPFLSVTAGAVLSFLLLYFAEKRSANPILHRNFIKRKAFILSITALFLTQGLMQANMTNIIVFVNYTAPQNTVISGYAISIMYIGMSLGAVILGPLADKYEPKAVLAGSLTVTGVGCAIMLLFNANTSVLLLASSLGILGFGLGANASVFMKVVLSGLSGKKASTQTGTYGLFRDLAAPFGVAVFVPMFTNGVTNNIMSGTDSAAAAVGSIRKIGIIEVSCVAVSIFVVLLLPRIYKKEKV